MYKAILLFLLLLIATGLQAADQTAWDRNARQRWSIVQLGLLPGEPTATRHSSTYGVKVGAPICDGAPVVGVEAALLYAGSRSVTGFQGSLITADCDDLTGLQFSLVNFVRDCAGLQLGLFNYATGKTFQIGILNYCQDSWCPWFPIVNFKF
ncbi:MAG: hypothetical protein IJC73_07595 [Lentisphaeria bacterium]|nr:hypothetical protein [Lentisphaeria bacterium]